MRKEININTDRFAVVGVGDTGISIIKYLKYVNANLVAVFDTRDNPPCHDILKDINITCGKLNFNNFNNVDTIVISPGISIYDEAIQEAILSGINVIGDIELFALAIKQWGSKVIGITGSNGKTTVTALTGYLAQSLGINTLIAGNIGVPVLDSYVEIMKTKNIPQLIVLELSSFQLESTYSLMLDSASVLNISEDHLDRYRDLLEYAYVKANIFNNCKTQIINKDDVLVNAMLRSHLKHKTFAQSMDADFGVITKENKTYITNNGKIIVDCDKLKLVGQHNFLNVGASLGLLDAANIEINDVRLIQALYEFAGLEHRMQKILVDKGVTYIEDSKGTNVGAVVAGVGGLSMPVHLILGGDGKGQDFMPLNSLVRNKCKSVAVIGQDKLELLKVLGDLAIPIANCDTLEEAILFCHKQAVSGDCVVLSPACASWDMFDNYKHRAQVFSDYVNSLVKNQK